MRAIWTRRSPSPSAFPWRGAARSRCGRSSSSRICRRISHEAIHLGGRVPSRGPTRPTRRSPEAAQDDQGRRARGDRGHQLRDSDVQAPRHAGGLRRVQGSLQPLHEHRPHEGVQESAGVVRHVQGHHPLYRRQAPPRDAGAEARQGTDRAERAQAVTQSDTHSAIDAVWRIESAQLIAGLARITRDVGLAEDPAPDAPVAALQRRAQRTLREARVPFDVPRGAELTARLSSVLEVIYLVFNEGYSATAGDEWVRPALCEDALRLGRILAELVPAKPEVHGLVALLEIQASRLHARVGPGGEPILLADQDRSRWDQLLIRRGPAALDRAEQLAGALGPYALQGAIAACHARARTPAETDWTRITALYDALAQLTQSPVVEVNRAVAYTMAFGPAAGLEIADSLLSEPALANYHLLPTVRGDFLAKLGRFEEARAEFERAAALTRNARERTLLLERAATCMRGP